METIKLSIGTIVGLVMRCGDIDSRFRDTAAMHKGSAAHRKIQSRAGDGYEKEVALRLEAVADDIPIILQGRADGIITDKNGGITIDEIKTTTLPLDVIFGQHEQHLAQAKCYAHMYLCTADIDVPDTVCVQLTYFQQESEEIRRHTWDFTPAELAAFFDDLLDKYTIWLRFQRDWAVLRDESIRHTTFPFDTYRRGQRELAATAYRTIRAQKKLFATAPTGIGKTLSALFPSVKAMAEGLADKLFYLTAKTITRGVAEDAIRLMTDDSGLRFKSITLRAKEKICPNAECFCTPDACERAKGHYARINDALYDLIEHNDLITADITIEYARKHNVCPHEFELDSSLWCDLIIGDYNHVFDPVVYLHRYFGAESKYDDKKYVFLIDEAHNLVDRVREMYSAGLGKAAFSHIAARLRGKDVLTRVLRKASREVKDHFADAAEMLEHQGTTSRVQAAQDAVFRDAVGLFAAAAGDWLAANKTNDFAADVLSLYFEVQRYLLIADLYDEHYTAITELKGKDVAITLFCLDTSKAAAQMLARGKAAIIFSATLSPLPYYRDILGGNDEDVMVNLPSPFDPDNLLIIAHCGISTKFADREKSYEPIAQAIGQTIGNRRGNYFAFFPSYEYMRYVHEEFVRQHPDVDTMMQSTEMTEEAREDFLRAFDADNEETLIGFVVLGGIFSEGIDLKGDRLIGAIITSVGIPRVSLRQDLIRDYFDNKNGQGYDYAYTFPGINKVLQAAGRVIRTESDSGVVVLIDSRYQWGKYRALLPRHWDNVRGVWDLARLGQALDPYS